MNAPRRCSCGRELTPEYVAEHSRGFTVVPESDEAPSYAQEWFHCECQSTGAVDLPIWRLESMINRGLVAYVPGVAIAKRVRSA